MRYIAFALALVQSFFFVLLTNGQAPAPLKDFGEIVSFTGYPGSLLFYNAFHRNRSTRLKLLKAIASSPESANLFKLSESQIKAIKELKPVSSESSNDSPDEQSIDPAFYSMLSQSQQNQLAALAIHFDGLAALSHETIAHRVGLDPKVTTQIQEIVKKKKEDIILPMFRGRFAGTHSEHEKILERDIDVRLLVLTNFEIAVLLVDADREKIRKFLEKDDLQELSEKIRTMAPLPDGLDKFHALFDELE